MSERTKPIMSRRGRKPQLTHYEEFYAAIGRFVLTWAHLEICLDLLLLKIVKTPERRAKLPHQLGCKIALIRSEIKGLTNDQQISITEVLDKISSYTDTRHDFVHGGMIVELIEQGVITVTLGRLLQPSRRPRRKPVKVTPPEIKMISDRIWELAGRLLDLAEAHY
jgi:hypothetical protein